MFRYLALMLTLVVSQCTMTPCPAGPRSSPAVTQCPGGACCSSTVAAHSSPERVPVPVSDCPKFSWEVVDAYKFWLRRDGVIVGQWWIADQLYYPWDGEKTGKACKPPIDPPGRGYEGDKDKLSAWCTNGVGKRDCNEGRECVTYGGKTIMPHQIKDAFDGKLVDDSNKGYFIVIAKDQTAREKVLNDWSKLPSDFTSRFNVWAAPPDHFSMIDRFAVPPKSRFFTEGDPTVVLEQPDGTVLFRRPQAQQQYKTADMQDLLKSDPNYNPKLDPGAPVVVHKPTNFAPLTNAATVISTLGAGLLGVFFLRRKK